MVSEWKLVSNPVPYLYIRFDGKVGFFFSTRYGISFLEEEGVKEVVYLRQIHSSKVLVLRRNPSFKLKTFSVDEIGKMAEVEGDGLMTDVKGLGIGVRVADCYPLYITSKDYTFVGVLHVGWRGLKEGIVDEGIETVKREWSIRPDSLRIAMGPGISEDKYEVGPEFFEYFGDFIKHRNGKYYFDIQEFATRRLLELGVKEENIVKAPFCTFKRGDLFHSRRREGENYGNQWAIAILYP